MIVEQTITVGNIIEVTSILGGGLFLLIRNNFVLGFMKNELATMQKEIMKITTIITANAVLEQRVLNAEEDIRDLRRGKGFIADATNGEYSRHGKVSKI